MSTTAVRIRFNAGSLPLTDVDFYLNEVSDIAIAEGRNSFAKRLGTGRPQEVRKTGFGSCRIAFNLFSTNSAATSTLSKLLQLEEHAGANQEFWVYPKFVDDPSLYFRLLLPRGQIPDEVAVAGMNAGNEPLAVEFFETTKVVYEFGSGDDDEYMDDIDETSPTEAV